MKHHRCVILLLLAVTLVACRSVSAPARRVASFDQDIELAPGEQVVFGQQQLQVEFVRVLDDSRCPTGVTCVWAGEVKVLLSIQIGAAAAVEREITTQQAATVDGFRLFLVQVQPERTATREISPEDYRIFLRVEQR